MTYLLNHRQRSRNSWSALLAVLLGVLTSTAAFGLSTSNAGGLSVVAHGADLRTTGNTASVRPHAFEPFLRLGGASGPDAALHARSVDVDLWTPGLLAVLPTSFDLPISVARARVGLTRAPPRA